MYLFKIKGNQQPRATYMFLGNVALSDFLTGASVLIEFLFLQENGCRIFNYIMIGRWKFILNNKFKLNEILFCYYY